MADEDVTWITINGSHVPIKEGQNKGEAIKEHFAKLRESDAAARPTDKEASEIAKKLNENATLPKPQLEGKTLSPLLQDIDGFGRVDPNDPDRKKVYSEWREKLKEKGMTYVDAYHVTNATADELKNGIKGSALDYIGKSEGNLRESSVYTFMDPYDIKAGYPGITGTRGDTSNVVHIKIPLAKLESLRWDSNFNISFDTYSAVRIVGNVPAKWIAGVYTYHHD